MGRSTSAELCSTLLVVAIVAGVCATAAVLIAKLFGATPDIPAIAAAIAGALGVQHSRRRSREGVHPRGI